MKWCLGYGDHALRPGVTVQPESDSPVTHAVDREVAARRGVPRPVALGLSWRSSPFPSFRGPRPGGFAAARAHLERSRPRIPGRRARRRGDRALRSASEAGAVATTLLLRRFGSAMIAQTAEPAAIDRALIVRTARFEPPPTRRERRAPAASLSSRRPLKLARCVSAGAAVTARDIVIEPSAGTGTLAAAAALGLGTAAGVRLALNELTSTRAGLLKLASPSARREPPRRRQHRGPAAGPLAQRRRHDPTVLSDGRLLELASESDLRQSAGCPRAAGWPRASAVPSRPRTPPSTGWAPGWIRPGRAVRCRLRRAR